MPASAPVSEPPRSVPRRGACAGLARAARRGRGRRARAPAAVAVGARRRPRRSPRPLRRGAVATQPPARAELDPPARERGARASPSPSMTARTRRSPRGCSTCSMRRGARATFFCVGERVASYPELAREIVARGHGHRESQPPPPAQLLAAGTRGHRAGGAPRPGGDRRAPPASCRASSGRPRGCATRSWSRCSRARASRSSAGRAAASTP